MPRCTYCGRNVQRNASFCPGCGKPIMPVPAHTANILQKNKLGFGAVVSILATVLLFAGLVFPILYHLFTEGAEFGRWAENDIVRDFNTVLSGRKSEYQKFMGTMQIVGLVIAFFLCLPGYLIMHTKDKAERTKGWLMPGIICSALLLTCWLLLLLFDFVGTPRTVVLVLFFILALLWVAVMILAAIKAKGFGILLTLLSLALGFLVASYLAAFVGAAAVIFGDLFWVIFGLVALFGGGGCSYIMIVYVY